MKSWKTKIQPFLSTNVFNSINLPDGVTQPKERVLVSESFPSLPLVGQLQYFEVTPKPWTKRGFTHVYMFSQSVNKHKKRSV